LFSVAAFPKFSSRDFCSALSSSLKRKIAGFCFWKIGSMYSSEKTMRVGTECSSTNLVISLESIDPE
jgi:hypothetical protein